MLRFDPILPILILVLPILILVAVCYSLRCGAQPTHSKDHLVTAEILFSKDVVTVAYRKAIEHTLYATPGELARFIQLPGATNPETVVSVYKVGGATPKYMVTCTQSSSSLWETVPRPGAPVRKNGSPMRVLRCDAEISASLASSIHRIWLTMLTTVKPEAVRRGVVSIDGTSEIFTAVEGGNRELHGAAPNEYPKNGRVSDLISLAFLLQAYCDPPPEGRDVVAAKLTQAVRKFPVN